MKVSSRSDRGQSDRSDRGQVRSDRGQVRVTSKFSGDLAEKWTSLPSRGFLFLVIPIKKVLLGLAKV